MKARPIIFSAPMVRAILAGAKTETRRVVAAAPHRYGVPGDLLWVKEGFARDGERVVYRADRPDAPLRWQSPLFMPRAASRLVLRVESVHAERLQDLDDVGARAEGMTGDDPVAAYRATWSRLHGEASWAADPPVWVVRFRRT